MRLDSIRRFVVISWRRILRVSPQRIWSRSPSHVSCFEPPHRPSFSLIELCYVDEPVWAIGTGLVCPKEVAQDVHKFIRSTIASKYGNDVARKVIIQYGGSVNANNVKELMAMPDIDGALVGGASLVADGFSKIVGYKH